MGTASSANKRLLEHTFSAQPLRHRGVLGGRCYTCQCGVYGVPATRQSSDRDCLPTRLQDLLPAYLAAMQSKGFKASTPLYAASGLLSYNDSSGEKIDYRRLFGRIGGRCNLLASWLATVRGWRLQAAPLSSLAQFVGGLGCHSRLAQLGWAPQPPTTPWQNPVANAGRTCTCRHEPLLEVAGRSWGVQPGVGEGGCARTC